MITINIFNNFKISFYNLFVVNLATLAPDITLNTFIREHAQLTATKFMCQEGGCGACVVSVKGKHPVTGQEKTWAVNSVSFVLTMKVHILQANPSLYVPK